MNDELEAFRQEWKKEVSAKLAESRVNSVKVEEVLKKPNKGILQITPSTLPENLVDSDSISQTEAQLNDLNHTSSLEYSGLTPLQLYHDAAIFERRGRLGEALALYRKGNLDIFKQYSFFRIFYFDLFFSYHPSILKPNPFSFIQYNII